MTVELTVEAAVVLTEADLRLQTQSGDELNDGGEVVARETLTVTATAFDYERLPIARAGVKIALTLDSLENFRVLELQYLGGNRYGGEVPSSWIETPGKYVLRVNSTAESSAEVMSIAFEVSRESTSLYVGLGVAALPLGALAALSVLAFKNRARAKQLFLSFASFEGMLMVEVMAQSSAPLSLDVDLARASPWDVQISLELWDIVR
jgi:hypothetical protein